MNPTDVWEIRHPTKAGVVSTAKNCGYDSRTLASLAAKGYELYCNGKPVQKKGEANGKKA